MCLMGCHGDEVYICVQDVSVTKVIKWEMRNQEQIRGCVMTVLFRMALIYVCCFRYFSLNVFIKVYGNLYYCSISPMKTRKGLNKTEPEVARRLARLPSRAGCPRGGTHLSHLCQTCWWEGEDDRQRRSLATKEWWVMSEGRSRAHAAPGIAGISNYTQDVPCISSEGITIHSLEWDIVYSSPKCDTFPPK